MPESEDPKNPEKVTNNDLRNSQFGGGVVNADTVNAQRIGGDIWNIRNLFLGQRDSSQSLNPRNRVQQLLLKQVSTEVESRLNQSLHNRIYIVQDTEQNPSQIELPWASEVKVGAKPKVHLTNTQITIVYDQPEIDGRLLILGQPGVGKTTMLLKLAEELVNRAKNVPTQHIPVLFSLSSWKDDSQSIKNWLVDQLKDKYGVRKDIGKQLVNNQEIIPLLDGLDEIAAERQEKCVIKINEFLHPSNWTNPVVVCSRIEEYQRYQALLQLNNSLELCTFTSQQVYQYLQKTEYLRLWNSINHNLELSELAKTPLLLNIIVLYTEEISIEKWQQFKSSQERLSYLFETYVSRMLKRKYKGIQLDAEKTKHWLGWLAQRLIEENSTEFLIENMQLYWLKNKFQKVVYYLVTWGIVWGFPGTLAIVLNPKIIRSIIPDVTSVLNSGLIPVLSSGLISVLIYRLIKNKIKIVENIDKIKYPYYKFLLKSLIFLLIYKMNLALIFWVIYLLIYLILDKNKIFEIIYKDFEYINLFIKNQVLIAIEIEEIKLYEEINFSIKKFGEIIIRGFIIIFILNLFFGYYKLNDLREYLLFSIPLIMYFEIKNKNIWVEIKNKNTPNQGIRNSIINTIFMFLWMFLVNIFLAFFIYLSTQAHMKLEEILINGLKMGGIFGVYLLLTMGTTVIKHFVLRVILWSNGYIPWNYAKFLDYCTNRLFLQRVGGGYRFMHDLLRQHFANSYNQKN